jgi:hypothetical protein
MKIRFSYIVALSAFLLASSAAYYSVFGLSQLFAGASLAVIIMASSLEFSKIISVSLLQRFWHKISNSLKIYLSIGVFILVCITSAGIYGFLSNAYQKTANKYQISENEISVLTNKKALFDKNILDNQNIINTKSKRLEQLSSLRNNQESRLDAATSNANRNRARNDISLSTLEIQNLNKDIDTLNAKNSILLDSSNLYSSKAIDAKSKSTTNSEIGPLKYLAQLTGYPMDKVVNYFILLLIFVFDPLAVALVIAFNKVQQLEQENVKTDNTEIPTIPFSEKNVEFKEDIKPEKIVEHKEKETEKSIEVFDDKEEIIEGTQKEIEDEIEESIEEPIDIVVEETIEEINKEPIEDVEEIVEIPIKNEPVIPNGKVELNDIKEIKETNRGFSMNIPHPKNNIIKRFK